MQMLALKAHRYGNVQRRPGDQFEVRASDVRLMKALGYQTEAQQLAAPPPVKTAANASKPKRSTYTRKVVKAEATVAVPPEPTEPTEPTAPDLAAEGQGEPEPEPVHRTYLRRDLVAEGE